jgi:hypothetical protein
MLETIAAGLQRRSGQAQPALERLKTVAVMFKKANAAVQWADAQQGVARCLIDQEKPADALGMLDEIETLRSRARDRFGLIRLYLDQSRARSGSADPVGAFRYACMARVMTERFDLGLHADTSVQMVIELAPSLDAIADTTARDVGRQATEAIDALEATWKAPPQPRESSTEIH